MKNIGKKFRESVVWELTRSAYSQGIQFFLSIVLARLLTPTDFGLVAIAYVVLRIAQVFSDVGFSSALIQDQKTDNGSYSTVFWINLMMGTIFFIFIQILAEPLGRFYDEPALAPVIRVLAIVFLLDALSQVQATILKKNLNFKSINRIIIFSETIAGVTAIVVAFSGWGVWSLVVQTLIFAALNLVLYWTSTSWRPSFFINWTESRRLFSFGSFVFVSHLLSRISLRVDTLVLGKVFSPATLGFYNRADSLLSLVKKYSSTSVIKVAFPYFSQLKSDEARFFQKYSELMRVVYFVRFLLSGLLFFSGRELIDLVYGPKWATAGEYLEVIVFTIFFYPANSIMNNLLLSRGLSKVLFKVVLIAILVRTIATVITVFIFSNIIYFLYAQVVISFLLNLAYMAALSYYVNIKARDQLRQFFIASGLFITAVTCSFVLGTLFSNSNTMYTAIIGSAGFMMLFIMLNFAFNFGVLKTLYLNAYYLITKN